MPGRKTDVADAVWIAQLVEHGLIQPSFVPPPPIRELRRKIPQLKQALTGRFTEAHALVLGEILRHIDYLEAAIQRTSKRVDEVISPFATERDLLTTIPGVDRRLAEAIIAEVGVDMTVFGNPRPFGFVGRHVSRTARIGGQVEVRTARHGPLRPGRADDRTAATTVSLCTSSPTQRSTTTSMTSPPRQRGRSEESASKGSLEYTLAAKIRGARRLPRQAIGRVRQRQREPTSPTGPQSTFLQPKVGRKANESYWRLVKRTEPSGWRVMSQVSGWSAIWWCGGHSGMPVEASVRPPLAQGSGWWYSQNDGGRSQ